MKQVESQMEQVFALVANSDATQLSLTAAEGYLLSRIDGTTPWRLLREMGGIPADEADSCLARWVEAGLLDRVLGAGSGPSTDANDAKQTKDAEDQAKRLIALDAAEAPAESFAIPAIDESLIDDRLDLDLDVQRRILEYEAGLDQPYHLLLDVPKGSEPKIVKRAYFKLSKEFHPDRYFRKEIGHHAGRLERIFKKVLEAHEMLSDPDLCQVENQQDVAKQNEAVAAPDAGRKATAGFAARPAAEPVPEKPKELTKLERLRQRMPFRINRAVIAARREKAQEIFRAAQTSQQEGRLSEAEANLRIAISFDPARSEFKEALGSIRIAAAGARAVKLLASPSDRMSNGELREALSLLEDVLIYRPHDPELNDRAARVCMQLGKMSDAREYAETLLERAPAVAATHTMMGRIHREENDLDAALTAFETALKLDPDDVEAGRALASMRIGERDAVRGGK